MSSPQARDPAASSEPVDVEADQEFLVDPLNHSVFEPKQAKKRAPANITDLKVQQYIDNRISGESEQRAAQLAGFGGTPQQALARATAALKGSRRDAFAASLVRHGITDDALVKRITDSLNARTYGLTRDGRKIELGPDHKTRLRTIEVLLKTLGLLDAGSAAVNVEQAVVIVRHTPKLG